MKRLKPFLLLLFITTFLANAQAQDKYEPTILILTPKQVTADKKLEKEIAQYNKDIKKANEQALAESEGAQREMEGREENMRIMFQRKLERIRSSDFYSTIPSVAEGFLQYRFFERFHNLLIYAIGDKSAGGLHELARLSKEHGVQYVLNFPEVNSWVENGSKITAVKVQLYDAKAGEVILEKVYNGHDKNPGFEFACSDGSLMCTFNNALSQALGDVTAVVAAGNPSIQKERKLAQERTEVLLTEFYSKEPESEIVDIIGQQDPAMSEGGFYQGVMDKTRTKFIGFFASVNPGNGFYDGKGAKDKQVSIIADDLTKLDNIPPIYAYIVAGVKHDAKWYMQKGAVTYFNAEDLEAGRKKYFTNLQNWNFFQEGSSLPNPAFWETNFFSKVEKSAVANQDEIAELKRLKERAADEEDRESYQDMIDHYYEEDLKNEGYFGLYTIVASELKKLDEAGRETFEAQVADSILTPFFDKQKEASASKITDYKKLNGKRYALIYPKNRDVVLCPILLEMKGGKSELHYYVLIPGEDKNYSIYRWTYFKPVTPQYKGAYGGDINAQLNTITKWNFSFDYLQDRKFWEEYVLMKEQGNFVNLLKVQ